MNINIRLIVSCLFTALALGCADIASAGRLGGLALRPAMPKPGDRINVLFSAFRDTGPRTA